MKADLLRAKLLQHGNAIYLSKELLIFQDEPLVKLDKVEQIFKDPVRFSVC